MGISLKFSGLDAAIKNVGNKIAKYEKEVQKELNNWANDTARLAKGFAPVNEGQLVGAINAEKDQKLKASVTVNVFYAAYIEFGTKKYAASYVAKLPPDWKAFAASFKGKVNEGSFNEFVQNIMRWVQLKGIGANKTKSGNISQSKDSLDAMQQAAYAIALNIIQNGIKPHPFLYPAYVETKDKLIKNIKAVLER